MRKIFVGAKIVVKRNWMENFEFFMMLFVVIVIYALTFECADE